MKVRAKMLGFYSNKRRYEGDVFDIEEKHFSKRWMDKNLEGEKAAPIKAAKTSDKDKAVI
jgi:hypothetical protein